MNAGELNTDLEMLEWQISMGADEAIGDEAVDWFAASAASMKAKAAANSIPKPTVPDRPALLNRPQTQTNVAKAVTSSQDEVADARRLAATCKTIDELIAALETFDTCALSRTATNLCFIDGNRDAKILIIGEVPGRDEDLQGKPFVGRAGQLLDKMLDSIDLARKNDASESSVLFSNTVFWRPPGNRKPTESETLMCLPFVNKLIELMAPKMIVCLGAMPTQRLTGETKGINRLRGRWFDYNRPENGENAGQSRSSIPILATLHPSYLLLQPKLKKLAWRDLIAMKQKLMSII